MISIKISYFENCSYTDKGAIEALPKLNPPPSTPPCAIRILPLQLTVIYLIIDTKAQISSYPASRNQAESERLQVYPHKPVYLRQHERKKKASSTCYCKVTLESKARGRAVLLKFSVTLPEPIASLDLHHFS